MRLTNKEKEAIYDVAITFFSPEEKIWLASGLSVLAQIELHERRLKEVQGE